MNLQRSFIGLLGLIALSHVVGCASIVAPGPDKVKFISDPDGASVSIDGAPVGSTPVIATVGRKAAFATFTSAGYDETTVPIAREANPWVYGNLIFGGLIGVIIDSSNGNMLWAKHEMTVQLHKNTARLGVSADKLAAVDLKLPTRPPVADAGPHSEQFQSSSVK